jgi:hypothetical protein
MSIGSGWGSRRWWRAYALSQRTVKSGAAVCSSMSARARSTLMLRPVGFEWTGTIQMPLIEASVRVSSAIWARSGPSPSMPTGMSSKPRDAASWKWRS